MPDPMECLNHSQNKCVPAPPGNPSHSKSNSCKGSSQHVLPDPLYILSQLSSKDTTASFLNCHAFFSINDNSLNSATSRIFDEIPTPPHNNKTVPGSKKTSDRFFKHRKIASTGKIVQTSQESKDTTIHSTKHTKTISETATFDKKIYSYISLSIRTGNRKT